MIKETIVVEGKNDAAAVKKAVDADIIITSGFGLNARTLELIKKAHEHHGVIVLTDPDYMGERIREVIAAKVKGVKHAFVPKTDARFEGDIGIENAAPEAIRKALEMAKTEVEAVEKQFDTKDLLEFGLTGVKNSSISRSIVGAHLGIGYGNSKQFLSRLNKYGISRQEFIAACTNIVKDEVNEKGNSIDNN
ncbi:MAG: ribonuclease M5 [Bacillota bacterium]